MGLNYLLKELKMSISLEKVNKYRVINGPFGTDDTETRGGLFSIKLGFGGFTRVYNVIVGIGDGWEHVSVSLPDKTPSWKTMCTIKDIFWDDEDVVMQLHPKKEDYVNLHQHTLHLWRPLDQEIPTPPKIMV